MPQIDWNDDDPTTAASAANFNTYIEARLRALELGGSGGGDPPVPATIEDIFTPAAGFFVDAGAYYIDGTDLVIPYMSIGRTAATALVAGQSVNIGTIDEEFWPANLPNYASFYIPGNIQKSDATAFTDAHVVPSQGDGSVSFVPHAAATGSANNFFNVVQGRWLLASALA